MNDAATVDRAKPDASGAPPEGGGLIWYELMTTDPAGAKRFYDPVVGWTIAEDSVAAGLEYRMIGRSDGGNAGGLFTLGEKELAGGAQPGWMIYIHVPDVDAAIGAIRADGGQVLLPPWDQAGVGRLAMATGPEGAPFYLMAPLPPEGDANAQSDVFSVDRPQHVRWNELWSSDPAASVDFYTRHFGWVQEGDMDMGPMGKYQFLYHGGIMIGAVMPRMADMPRSMWNIYIGVDDIDRATGAVRAGGGQVVQEPMEIPGGDYSVNAVDPHGAMFGLVGPRKAAGE